MFAYTVWLIVSVYSQTLKLPAANSLLLRHLLCILCRIVRHADENRMTSANLATCIAPSLLWDPAISNPESLNAATASQTTVIKLVDHLIVHAADIWKDPADCIELLQSRKMLGSQSAVSSLSVQTVSSSGSLSDSEDSSPKGMIWSYYTDIWSSLLIKVKFVLHPLTFQHVSSRLHDERTISININFVISNCCIY